MLAGAGCGQEERPPPSSPAARPAPPPAANDTRTSGPAPRSGEEGERSAPPAGESGEGGAGDEEPIRSEAAITGRGGRLSPRRVSVPAFIAVRLTLRSGDGVAGRTLRASSGHPGSVTLDGLTPGRSYVARGKRGTAGSVVVSASAEPGP
jgi:hypothetical protein